MTSKARGDIAGQPRRYLVGHNGRLPWPDRFWAKVVKSDGCWEWQGASTPRGYGRVQINGRPHGTNRVSLAMAIGRELAPGEMACHTCDNPPCVRPDHLFVGNAADNVHDAEAKQRRAYGDRHWLRVSPDRALAGALNPSAKLTQRQVDEIRARYRPGVTKVRALAAEFGVGKSTISLVVRRETWQGS